MTGEQACPILSKARRSLASAVADLGVLSIKHRPKDPRMLA